MVAKDSESKDKQNKEPRVSRLKNKKTILGVIVVVVIMIVAAVVILRGGDISSDGNGDGNHPPTADAGGDKTVYATDVVTFDAKNSTDADQDKLTFTWEFSDNIVLKGEKVTRKFDKIGDYNANLSVDDGKAKDVDTLKIKVLAKVTSEPPTITLSQEGIPGTIATPKKYIVTVSSAEPAELIENFTFAIVESTNGAVLLKKNVEEVSGIQGNVTFVDKPVQGRLDRFDTFTITPNDSTLPADNGDKFILYYLLNSIEYKVAEVEFSTIPETANGI